MNLWFGAIAKIASVTSKASSNCYYIQMISTEAGSHILLQKKNYLCLFDPPDPSWLARQQSKLEFDPQGVVVPDDGD